MALINKLAAIGDAIRAKTGKADKLTLDQMPVEIASIETGGGTGGSGESGDMMVVCEDAGISPRNILNSIEGLRVSCPNAEVAGDSALRDVTTLISIDLSKVMYIGVQAFADCTSLTNINLPLATSIGDSAFDRCTSLTNINLPLATSIGAYSFGNCTSLTNADLPNVTTIRSYTFHRCASLTEINIPKVVTVGENAFANCTSLTNINLPLATSIGAYSFGNCTSLTNINLPKCKSIGSAAFSNCIALTNIDLPVATSVGNRAFLECNALTSIDLPLATSIGDSAFYDTSLDTLILRNSETVCNLNVTALFGTKILTDEGMPTGEGFVYVPTALYEQYVASLVEQVMSGGHDEATAIYLITSVLRKIEDYPEICGDAYKGATFVYEETTEPIEGLT